MIWVAFVVRICKVERNIVDIINDLCDSGEMTIAVYNNNTCYLNVAWWKFRTSSEKLYQSLNYPTSQAMLKQIISMIVRFRIVSSKG